MINAPFTTPVDDEEQVATDVAVNAAPAESIDAAPAEDVTSETLPPLYSFGDPQLFKDLVEEQGLEEVTRKVVGFAQQKMPHLSFTLETLQDGTADLLDFIKPETELPPQSRAMALEEILAVFTDVEDYGKYETPVQKTTFDGTPLFDPETNEPVYEDINYNLSAIAGGARNSVVPAVFLTAGGWQGARLGAAAYAARAPVLPNPLAATGTKIAYTGVGAIVGSGIMTPLASYVNEWLFEEPDPIVVPSLQAAYNSGETAAYGLTFLASPWVGTKLAGKDLSQTFNAAKALSDFKTIASKEFDPNKAIKVLGDDVAAMAEKAIKVQSGKGAIRKKLTPDQTKGPVSARITDTLIRGGAEALDKGKQNPGSFLGIEALMATSAGVGAYAAEKIAPNSEAFRLFMEVATVPPAILTIKAATGAISAGRSAYNRTMDGSLREAAGLDLSGRVGTESGNRLLAEVRDSPEYAKLSETITQKMDSDGNPLFDPETNEPVFENPEEALDNAMNLLQNYGSTEEDMLPSEVLYRAKSPFAATFQRIEQEVNTRTNELSVATKQGRERFVAAEKQKILSLRATDSPEALFEAAAIEQRLMEQQIIDDMTEANTAFVKATNQLFGNTEEGRTTSDLSLKFFDLQQRLVAGLKARRTQLYGEVPDFDLKVFTNAKGETVDVPNMVSIFDEDAGTGGLKFSSAGARKNFNLAVGAQKEDIDGIITYYQAVNPDVGADPIESMPSVVAKKFKALEKLGVATRINPETNRVELAPTDLMGATQTNAQEEAARKKFNDVQTYLENFSAVPDADNLPEFPMGFAKLREVVSDLRSTRAKRIKDDPSDQTSVYLSRLIDAIEQDMFHTPSESLSDVDKATVVALKKAHAYNNAMHNVTSRSFVSIHAKMNAQRGLKTDPTEAVKAVMNGDNIPLSRINEMQYAINFLKDEDGKRGLDQVKEITYTNRIGTEDQRVTQSFDKDNVALELGETIEFLVRDARKNIVKEKTDPVTGVTTRTVDLKLLNKYKNLESTKQLFSIFPTLARDLDSVESAQILINQATASAKALRNSPQQIAFSKFLDRPESGSMVIGNILAGQGGVKSPRETLQKLVDTIKLGSREIDPVTNEIIPAEYTVEETLDGLRSAIINYAVTGSGGTGTSFNPTRFFDLLFSEVQGVDAVTTKGGLKLSEFMKNNGMVNQQYLDDLTNALNKMRNIEEGLAKNDLSGNLFKRPSLASIGMLKIGGAMVVGASLARFKNLLGKIGLGDFGIGAGVVAGEVGAEAAPRLFLTGPETLVVNNMSRILADPEMLAIAIKEARSAKEFDDNLNAIQKLLGAQVIRQIPKVERDITADESAIRPNEFLDREADFTKQLESGKPVQTVPVPQAQKVTQLQQPVPPPTMAQAPVAPPTAPSGPVDRSQYAALFPNDMASGLIRASNQGIGSLMT